MLCTVAPVMVAAAAEQTPAPGAVEVSGAQALKIAENLLLQDELDEAEAILAQLGEADPGSIDLTQVAFLRGLVAVAREDYAGAAIIFRAILNNNPELIRIRLELARALFMQEEDAAAAYHFRYVLGNGLPEETVEIVRRHLRIIEQRKVWHVRFGGSIVPNSNINAGPKDDTVTLFGLPFQLDDEAQKTGGTGLSTSFSVAAIPRLSERLRFESRLSARVVDHSNIDFDDVFIALEAGPRYQTARWFTSLLATASKRWYGGEDFSTSYGGRMEITTSLSRRMRFSTRFSYAQAEYDTNPLRDGPVYSAGISVSRVLDKRTIGGLGVQVTREEAAANNLKNHQVRLNAFLSREFPLGLTGQIAPEYYVRDFQSSERLDETYGLTLRLTKRDWYYYGFAPVFSYTYLKNTSNNPFFNYDRHSADIGLTREF